jgi:hypothetical protein
VKLVWANRSQDFISKTPPPKRVSGVSQVVRAPSKQVGDPEFKPQCHKKKKKGTQKDISNHIGPGKPSQGFLNFIVRALRNH